MRVNVTTQKIQLFLNIDLIEFLFSFQTQFENCTEMRKYIILIFNKN